MAGRAGMAGHTCPPGLTSATAVYWGAAGPGSGEDASEKLHEQNQGSISTSVSAQHLSASATSPLPFLANCSGASATSGA